VQCHEATIKCLRVLLSCCAIVVLLTFSKKCQFFVIVFRLHAATHSAVVTRGGTRKERNCYTCVQIP